jgi:hypothetical protein
MEETKKVHSHRELERNVEFHRPRHPPASLGAIITRISNNVRVSSPFSEIIRSFLVLLNKLQYDLSDVCILRAPHLVYHSAAARFIFLCLPKMKLLISKFL